MSLAETIERSDWRMDEADKAAFAKRVLSDGEDVLAAFSPDSKHTIAFADTRLVLESVGTEWTGVFSSPAPRKRLTSIPYKSISMHAVVLDTTRDPSGRRGVLRIWVPGYYNDKGRSDTRWIDVDGQGKLDLHLLSDILASQMAK